MLVVHSLASWAAHITDAPNPTADLNSAENGPNSDRVSPNGPLLAATRPVQPEALNDASAVNLVGTLNHGHDEEDVLWRTEDGRSPTPAVDFASPSTQETTPGPGGQGEDKSPSITAGDEDEESRHGEINWDATERETLEPANARRVIDLMNRQARSLNAPIFTMSCVAGGVLPDEPPLSFEEQRLASLVSLLCSGGIQDPKPWESTRNLREYLGGAITLDRLLAADQSQIQKQLRGGMEPKNARFIKAMAEQLRDEFEGLAPPPDEAALLSIKGIGSSKAQLYIEKFGTPATLRVSKHVNTVSARLSWQGLSRIADLAEPADLDDTRVLLEPWLPQSEWQAFSDILAGFGQKVCGLRPNCAGCDVGKAGLCPSFGIVKRPVRAKASKRAKTAASGSKEEEEEQEAREREWEPRGGPGLEPDDRLVKAEGKPKLEVTYDTGQGASGSRMEEVQEATSTEQAEPVARVAETSRMEGTRRSGRKRERVSYAGQDAGDKDIVW